MRKVGLAVLLLAGVLMAADAPTKQPLADSESVKGMDLIVKFERNNSQIVALQQQQRELQRSMADLSAGILKAHKLDESKWAINWDDKSIEPIPEKK